MMKQKRKYNLFGGLLVSMTLLTTACAGISDLDTSQIENNEEKTVTITVMPESLVGGMRNTTISDGTKADKLIYALYDVTGETAELVEEYSKTVENVTYPYTDITIKIKRGKEYEMAFWAQSSSCNAFVTDDLQNVQVKYDQAKNNNEFRDAFCAKLDIKDYKNSYEVTLYRPFAQVNVGTTGADYKNIMKNPKVTPNLKVTQSKITLQGVAQYINVLTNEVDDNSLKDNVIFDFATIPAFMNMEELPTGDALYKGENSLEEFLEVDLDKDKKIKGYKTKYPTLDKEGNYLTETFKYLSMCYVLVPAKTSNVPDGFKDVDAVLPEVKVSFAETGDNGAAVKNYTPITIKNVPVRRNWRTNILGGLKWMKDPTDPGDPNNPDPDDPEPPGPDDPSSVFGVVNLKIILDSDYENGYIDWDKWEEIEEEADEPEVPGGDNPTTNPDDNQ